MIALNFPIKGSYFPSDHNYGTYASLIHFNKDLRCLNWQLGTITGHPQKNGLIKLGSQSSLIIRCGINDIERFIDLTILTVGKWSISLKAPVISQISPDLELSSRIAVIKSAKNRKDMMRSLLRQSQELGINANYIIGERKTIKIKRYTIIGFEIMANCATEKDSLILQENGLGGKRKMGCGVFHA
jgi:CRISPR-associated protein Cas6